MKKEILLVDDEEGIRRVLGISLADRGYRVHTAADGEEALALFEKYSPAIVLTDIKMPGMDGLQVLKTIKGQRPETEVIMITGHGDIDLAIKSLKYEATDFIAKPIDEEMLDVALKRAWERISMRDQLRAYTENLEQLVAEKSRRLVQAERLAAMGETVAGLAHAIKNISGGLKGGVFVVDKGFELDNRQYLEQGWRMVNDNVERIHQLALDLLNIANPALPNLKPVDPNRPLLAVHQLMASRAQQNGIELTIRTDETLPEVPLDAEAMHRCLLNLVTNALDACRQSGCNGEALQGISLVCQKQDAKLIYKVTDTCGGMPPDVARKLFKGFFTTKGSRGTGIGLMLSRKIVENHKGAITVDTEQGQGTTVTICLPLAPS